jgi:F-type H+-transporting ATPase subunit epsilon
MAALLAQLISPDRIAIEGEMSCVMLPGIEGDMTVLVGHQRVMTLLRAGLVVAVDLAGHAQRVYARGAFAEITATTVTILAEQALPFEELSPPMIDEELTQLRMRADATEGEIVRSWIQLSITALEDLKKTMWN